MLLVQKKLKDGIETLDTLIERFGIHSKEDDNGLIILDYDQIDSHHVKDHQVVRECRGLVLDSNFNIVAKSFDRFFNYGENNDTEIFDWKNFKSYEKVDGSLIRVVWFDNDYRVFTRYSFGDSIVEGSGKTWTELVLSCLNDEQKQWIKNYPGYTFVFEFCSPWTQVVKYFEFPKLVLLAMYSNRTGDELKVVPDFIKTIFDFVREYKFNSIDQVLHYLDVLSDEKSTDEGFVLVDKNGTRLKIKSKYYLILHRLSNNGNVCNMKNIIPIILKGEEEEIITYFPHVKNIAMFVKEEIENDLQELQMIYNKVIVHETQKDFAIALTKETYTPYTSLFFNLKKEFGNSFTFEQLKQAYLEAEDLVIKVFKTRGLELGV